MRITAFIFSLFYLISSVGYGIEVHYCLGRISDVNHFMFETHCACDEAGIMPEKSCCEERVVYNQLDDEHTASANLQVEDVQLPLIATIDLELLENQVEEVELEKALLDRGPPCVRDIPIELVRLITYG